MPAISEIPAPPLPNWVVALKDAERTDGGPSIAASDLTIVKLAAPTVLNGSTIVYTITIANNGAVSATQINLVDTPPQDTEVINVNCTDCTKDAIVRTEIISSTLWSPLVTLTYTELITWYIPALNAGETITKVFSIDVPCKTEGIVLKNQAFINYQQGGGPGTGLSQQTATEVVIPNDEVGLSSLPSWCSETVRGVASLDWGDFDTDGYLDLVLASGIGTVIYRSEQGKLTRFWTHPRPAFDARWADFDGDGDLDLVSIGDGPDFISPGTNYVHRNNGGAFTTVSFTSNDGPGFRVEPGNFDIDSAIELALSHNVGGAVCGVRLYQFSGVVDNFNFIPAQCLQDNYTSAGLGAADYDNDGDLDLAMNEWNGTATKVLINSGVLNKTNFISITTNAKINSYDMAWGDYSGNGYLDLAVAYPWYLAVQVYENNYPGGFTLSQTINAGSYSVDWADFDQDGLIDSVVGAIPPRIYRYSGGSFSLFKQVSGSDSFIWKVRSADHDGDGDLDLVHSGVSKPTRLVSNLAPRLASTLSPIDSFRANSVAWGDSDSDGDLDLLFGVGGGSPDLGSRLYNNTNGNFSSSTQYISSGFGPHSAAFGDVNRDGKLDIAIATLGQIQIYLNGNSGSPNWSVASVARDLAWADADLSNNGSLDLLVGANGQNSFYLNSGLQSITSMPIWSSSEADDTRSVAWGFFNGDVFPDFAAGNDGQPSRVYRNNNGKDFTLVWSSPISNNTRSVAWGDYDSDGDMDLAVGNYNQTNYIYENLGGSLSQTPISISTAISNTTSLAWGDWNNDGNLELAVGNDSQKDQVYANVGQAGAPKLLLLWESAESYKTTGVAWGDKDNDGDLDLAISQESGGQNGVYENTYVRPAHLNSNFAADMPLPHNPSYVSVGQPGSADAAYFFSSAEVFSITTSLNPPTSTLIITIPFKVYDPDGTRNTLTNNAQGDPIAKINYEFSLDGGVTWKNATTATENFTGVTYRLGQSNPANNWTVGWNAGVDLNSSSEVVNDDVRFRITVVHQNRTGLVQRAMTSGVSLPFRVRKLQCIWPDNASIEYQGPITPNVSVRFEGDITNGEGQEFFSWDFGDNTAVVQAQDLNHTYVNNGIYTITLTVGGPDCPVTREAVTITQVIVGESFTETIYLPVILKSSDAGASSSTSITAPAITEPDIAMLDFAPDAPAQVTGLQGNIQAKEGTTRLEWRPNPPDDPALGYRVYRSTVGEGVFRQLADVPADMTTYTDATATCGHAYFVTAYNAQGEAIASTSSYYSPPCR